MRQRRGISEHISERKPAFRERETPGQKGISTKAFLTNGWCTKRFGGQRPLTTTLVEGTGVLRTGVLENRRSGKTGVPEAAVLGNGVSRKRAHRNGRRAQNFWKIYPFICADDSVLFHDDYGLWSYPQMNSRR